MLYTALASVMGAREKFPQTEAEVDADLAKAHAQQPPASKAEPPASPLLWVVRVVALGALAVCLFWPIWIFLQGGEGFDARFMQFRAWLIVPTLVYFVAGTTWAVLRDKAS